MAAHEIGFDTLFFYTWDIREKVMDLLEALTGNRVNYAMLTIGGVRRDFIPEQMTILEDTLDYYRELFDRTREILLDDITIQMRCRDVGILTYEEAVAYCAVGTYGQGVGTDERRTGRLSHECLSGHSLAEAVSPRDLSMEPRGDVFDRMIVRVLEMKQSIDIVQFCMDNMPEGPVALETKAIKLINQLEKDKGRRHRSLRGAEGRSRSL